MGRGGSGERVKARQSVEFYVDGACSGNHRQGQTGRMGAGIVAVSGEQEQEWSIPLGPGTNQKAELLAVREALLTIEERPATEVTIYSDSQYAIGCLTKGWNVKANGELVATILPLVRECASFRMTKVPGHAGHSQNERADILAVAATQTKLAADERG